jgi:AcrR family transcriptional regulator/L-amino acid N-acyltransferase YncA
VRVTSDAELRRRIVAAAAELFTEHGYEGTRIRMVAQRADVTPRTVRRLTGGRSQLFAIVIAETVTSAAADQIARAAEEVGATEPQPPLAAIIAAAGEVFAAPTRSWDLLELEALTRAHRDTDLRAIESDRIQRRWDNLKTLVERIRAAGGIDDTVDGDVLAHFSLALSVGLAMIDPALENRPRREDWDALMARIGVAVAPSELLLTPDRGARAYWRIRVDVPDRPGGVAQLIRAVAALHTYSLAMYVIDSAEGTRTLDLAVTAPESVTEETLRAAALSGGRNAFVRPGSPDDALDLPTRIMDGATELVANPGWAPFAAEQLVEADRVRVVDATEGEDDRTNVLRLQWTQDRHVLLSRDWAPFARTEQQRASALLRLFAAIATAAGDTDAQGWIEPVKAGTVWIRLAHPEDSKAVTAMHRRCSPRTLYQRYVSSGDWQEIQMRRLSGGHSGATLVAVGDQGTVIGLGNVFPERPGDEHSAEIALLVEDDHQGRGVGTALLRHLLRVAQRMGFAEVVGVVLADNTGMLHLLEATDLHWSSSIDSGVRTMRTQLPTDLLPPSADP